MVTEMDEKALGRAAELLKAMSNPSRLAILCWLGEGEKSVGEMADFIGLSQSALSQHLAKLRSLGLVNTRRDQQNIFYSLASSEAQALIKLLHKLYCSR